jgi:hypothetical protein
MKKLVVHQLNNKIIVDFTILVSDHYTPSSSVLFYFHLVLDVVVKF